MRSEWGARSALEALAAWCAALEWRAIPADQRALVPLRVLDTVGLVLAGVETDATRAVADFACGQGGAAAATLLTGTARVALPAPAAALVHGVAAHCRDFDDTFADSVVHPGSAVVPAGLAAGEAAGAAPEAIGAAIVAGYEVAARIGAVAGRRFHARGLHATGVVGPIAAAAAAARAGGLGGDATASAMGLAASMSGGLMAFQADGAWSKWLHAGWAAQGGVTAAALAARGFRGPRTALDGPGNLFGALLAGEACDLGLLARGLGGEWRGGAARFKYYPCAHVIQPYIDAALALGAAQGLAPGDIESVRCPIAPWAAPIVCEPRAAKLAPATELDAIASLPYMVALALLEGGVTLAALAPESRARADVLALARRVACPEDAALGRGFDARVEIRTRAGIVHAQAADAAALDPARLVAKFAANAEARLGRLRAQAAAEALAAMAAPDPGRIAALLFRSPASRGE
jgi:2-methylcitrate dehydratase PrpD